MKEYHKIQTVFLRSPESRYKTLMEGHWALPEFDVLKDIPWVWTEKIDGTNMRIMWNGDHVTLGGKTDQAQIPASLVNVLREKFTTEKMNSVFKDSTEVCLYGEGYGAGIQQGAHYLPNRVDFILFDCRINGWWLTRSNLEDIAAKLAIGIVPVVGTGTLRQAIDLARKGFASPTAHDSGFVAEGLVMKPCLELFNRRGSRIIAKIKSRDFRKR